MYSRIYVTTWNRLEMKIRWTYVEIPPDDQVIGYTTVNFPPNESNSKMIIVAVLSNTTKTVEDYKFFISPIEDFIGVKQVQVDQ